MFNNLIASDLINSNISVIVANHGSSTFVDSEGFLCKSLSSVKEGDVLHLNGKGKGQFAKLIKSYVFQGKRSSRQVTNKLFSAAVVEGQGAT